MADNSPTAIAKGSNKKEPKTIEEMEADRKRAEAAEPLTAESTEPVIDGAAQPAADLALEQARGQVFGDLSSSTGDKNTRGLHGRDGGVVPEGPSNPAPSEKAQNPEPVDRATDEIEEARLNKDQSE